MGGGESDRLHDAQLSRHPVGARLKEQSAAFPSALDASAKIHRGISDAARVQSHALAGSVDAQIHFFRDRWQRLPTAGFAVEGSSERFQVVGTGAALAAVAPSLLPAREVRLTHPLAAARTAVGCVPERVEARGTDTGLTAIVAAHFTAAQSGSRLEAAGAAIARASERIKASGTSARLAAIVPAHLSARWRRRRRLAAGVAVEGSSERGEAGGTRAGLAAVVPSHLSARGGRRRLLATRVAVERPSQEIEARGTRPGLTAIIS